MGIYATEWWLKFPKHGDYHTGCEWIDVLAEGVPPHIGSSTPGRGYENGDPFAEFLPPAVPTDADGDAEHMRTVVFVTREMKKGTPRHPQEYEAPLLVLDGEQYSRMAFHELHERICDALRGDRPHLTFEIIGGDGRTRVLFDDGTEREVSSDQ